MQNIGLPAGKAWRQRVTFVSSIVHTDAGVGWGRAEGGGGGLYFGDLVSRIRKNEKYTGAI